MNSSFDPDMLAARSESRAVGINRIYNFVYGWMSAALVISAVAAWKMMHVIAENSSILSNGLMFGLVIAEFALVVGMTAAVHKLPLIASIIMFAVYAALNGVTLSVLLLVYAQSTVQLAFFTAAGTFAGMALLGTVIKKRFLLHWPHCHDATDWSGCRHHCQYLCWLQRPKLYHFAIRRWHLHRPHRLRCAEGNETCQRRSFWEHRYTDRQSYRPDVRALALSRFRQFVHLSSSSLRKEP